MLKKMIFLQAVLLTFALIISCGGSPGFVPDPNYQPPERIQWSNPEFNIADVTDIGNQWTLDITNTAPVSWSDNDRFSMNPQEEVAAVAENPNGGLDFTFTKFNQRIIFVLNSSQIHKIMNATSVEVTIDGEASRNANFRYHIGNSELGSNWNATNSPAEGPFSTILNATINLDQNKKADFQDLIRNFMIQSRGGANRDEFEPVTVTIRSITFRIIP